MMVIDHFLEEVVMQQMSNISNQMVEYILPSELSSINVDMKILKYTGDMASVISKLAIKAINETDDPSTFTYDEIVISDVNRAKLLELVDKLLVYVNLLNFSKDQSVDFDIDPDGGFEIDDTLLIDDHMAYCLIRNIIELNTAASEMVDLNDMFISGLLDDNFERSSRLHQLIVRVYTLSVMMIHMLGSDVKLEMDKTVSLLRMEYAIHARSFDEE